LLAARLRERTTAEWLAELEAKGVLCARINTIVEAADDAQLQANQMVVDMDHPAGGSLRLLGTPVRLYGTPPQPRVFAPELGAHTREVLLEFGYSAERVADLESSGIVHTAAAVSAAVAP
jgi:crotonobetainyl-CoA:carnitine CoA-transferase CaiB-like acyl-CoA transferase